MKGFWVSIARIAIASACIAAGAAPLSASTVRSRADYARVSDAIVTGVIVFPDGSNTATLFPMQVRKGASRANYVILVPSADEVLRGGGAADVPPWRPLYDVVKGTFYLERLPHHQFRVIFVEDEQDYDRL